MTARSLRRAAERKAASPSPATAIEEIQISSRRSTGPTTPEGKAVSCLNRLKHGLTGTFRVLEFESQSLFRELCDSLRQEHAPATPTQTLLVDRMAEHVWLSQRAQRLQDDALFEQNEKSFALYLRYQTTNDRGFHRCLRELATLRRERRERREFESQRVETTAQATAQAAPSATNTTAIEAKQPPFMNPTTSSNRKTPIAFVAPSLTTATSLS